MKYSALLLATVATVALVTAFRPAPAVHCQVPCGIYGDSMRISMIREDAQTIEKGMLQILELEGQDAKNYNQIVRWVTTKDDHASKIQDNVAAYWLAQRIKAPADSKDQAARAKYLAQLEHLHGVTVAAMKCKQTTDVSNVATLRRHLDAFSATYFNAEEQEHMHEEHGDHK